MESILSLEDMLIRNKKLDLGSEEMKDLVQILYQTTLVKDIKDNTRLILPRILLKQKIKDLKEIYELLNLYRKEVSDGVFKRWDKLRNKRIILDTKLGEYYEKQPVYFKGKIGPFLPKYREKLTVYYVLGSLYKFVEKLTEKTIQLETYVIGSFVNPNKRFLIRKYYDETIFLSDLDLVIVINTSKNDNLYSELMEKLIDYAEIVLKKYNLIINFRIGYDELKEEINRNPYARKLEELIRR